MDKIAKIRVFAHDSGDGDISSFIRKSNHSSVCKNYNKKIRKYRSVIKDLEHANMKKKLKIKTDGIFKDILHEMNPELYNEAIEKLHEKICDLIDSKKI